MDFANEIRNSLDTQEVFSNYGLRPNRSGFVCCFLNNERTPSMKVYKGNGGYHCFGCGAHGSIIDFVMQYFGLNFQDAIAKINTDFSLGLPIGERISLRQRREIEHRQRERQEERNREQRERERLEGEYWVAFDVWEKCDANKREYAPKSPSEDFHQLFVEAAKNIDRAAYELSVAEMRLKDYANHRQYNNQH